MSEGSWVIGINYPRRWRVGNDAPIIIAPQGGYPANFNHYERKTDSNGRRTLDYTLFASWFLPDTRKRAKDHIDRKLDYHANRRLDILTAPHNLEGKDLRYQRAVIDVYRVQKFRNDIHRIIDRDLVQGTPFFSGDEGPFVKAAEAIKTALSITSMSLAHPATQPNIVIRGKFTHAGGVRIKAIGVTNSNRELPFSHYVIADSNNDWSATINVEPLLSSYGDVVKFTAESYPKIETVQSANYTVNWRPT